MKRKRFERCRTILHKRSNSCKRHPVLRSIAGFAVLSWLSYPPIVGAQIVGSVDTPGWASAVVVDAGYAYIADASSGLTIVDVSDPTDPQVVTTVDTPGFALGVDFAGGIVYVADFGGGLRLFDVSNPNAPSPLGSTDTPGDARKVVVSGTTAFVADDAGDLTIVDVSSSASPSVVTSFSATGMALDVDISGTLAFVSTGWSDPIAVRGAIEIIDVTDVADPSAVARLDLADSGFGFAVRVVGPRAYVVRGTTVLVPPAGFHAALDIIDVSNPSEPQPLGLASLQLPTDAFAHQYGVCISDTQAICTSGDGGLNFVDMENPNHPFYLGYIPMTAEDVVMDGDYLYVAAREYGLIVVDKAAIPEVPFPASCAWLLILALVVACSGIAVSRGASRMRV